MPEQYASFGYCSDMAMGMSGVEGESPSVDAVRGPGDVAGESPNVEAAVDQGGVLGGGW